MHASDACGEGTPQEGAIPGRAVGPAPTGSGGCGVTPDEAVTGRRRRIAIVTLSIVAAAMIVATGAQAYSSGQLIWAKKTGGSTNQAGTYAVAGGPNGTTAIAGWRSIQPEGQPSTRFPMVASYSATGSLRWTRTYRTSPGYAEAVACDRSGNVYVAATVNPGGTSDLLLLKYDPAGNLKWERLYDGPAHLDDLAEEVAVDRAGDVVVVGRSKAASTKAGIVIIKYKPGGAEAWAAPVRFDAEPADPNAGWVYAVSLALDAAGDVYVAGGSTHRVSGAWIESALTLKFDAATGAKEWGQLYDAQHGVQSYAQDIVVRGGRVVIVGSTWGMTFGADENGLLVRYEAASGAQKYWKEWGADNPMGEWFGDVVLDGSGYVYVTGDQRRGGTGSFDRAVTLKLTPSLSKVVWKATFLPATRSAAGWYIVRDRQGNVYVSGVKHDARANDDFVTIKYGPGGGQKWVRVWSGGGPDNDEPHGLVLGTTGGVHAGGQTTVKDGTERAILLKYQR